MGTHQGEWSLARCSLSIAGLNVGAGAGAGSMFKAVAREDWRTVTVGIQGDTVVNERLDRSADFEITLSQKATINQGLQALLNLSLAQDGTVGIGPLMFTELEGGTVISGDCILVGPPEYDAQGEVQDLVWRGVVLNCDWKVGGI